MPVHQYQGFEPGIISIAVLREATADKKPFTPGLKGTNVTTCPSEAVGSDRALAHTHTVATRVFSAQLWLERAVEIAGVCLGQMC